MNCEEAIGYLKEVPGLWENAAFNALGKSEAEIYAGHLKRVTLPIIQKHMGDGVNAEAFWQERFMEPQDGPGVLTFLMAISGNQGESEDEVGAGPKGWKVGRGGTLLPPGWSDDMAPDGGDWDDWFDKRADERLASIDDDYIQDWVDDFKDWTISDYNTGRNRANPSKDLADKVRSIITGGKTHEGHPEYFLSDGGRPDSLADVAGIHKDRSETNSPDGAMGAEILAAWIVFMTTHPDGAFHSAAKTFNAMLKAKFENK